MNPTFSFDKPITFSKEIPIDKINYPTFVPNEEAIRPLFSLPLPMEEPKIFTDCSFSKTLLTPSMLMQKTLENDTVKSCIRFIEESCTFAATKGFVFCEIPVSDLSSRPEILQTIRSYFSLVGFDVTAKEDFLIISWKNAIISKNPVHFFGK